MALTLNDHIHIFNCEKQFFINFNFLLKSFTLHKVSATN